MSIMKNLFRLILASAFIVSMPVSALIIVDTPPDTPPPPPPPPPGEPPPPPSNTMILDAGWYGSCFISGVGSGAETGCGFWTGEAVNSMVFDLTSAAELKLTSLLAGDVYELYVNSVLTMITNTPTASGITALDANGQLDPDMAFASTDFSSESIVLGPGSYSIDIFLATLSPDNPFAGLGISAVEVQSVPVPAAIWLFGSGLLGLIGIARRKKTA